jgi:hypothetical protein
MSNLPTLGGIPTKLVFISLSLSKGVQVKKQSKNIHLPNMGISNKVYIPLMGIIG